MVQRHLADGSDGVDECVAVHGGRAPKLPEQTNRADLVQELTRLAFIERCHPEHHILERFCQYTTQAEHHHGAELMIPRHTDDEFAAPRDHLLHQDALQSDGGTTHERFETAARAGVVRDIQEHQSCVRLVLDLGRQSLHHHRVPQPAGDFDRLIGRAHGGTLHHRDAVGREQRLGLRLIQRPSPGRQRPLHDMPARCRRLHRHDAPPLLCVACALNRSIRMRDGLYPGSRPPHA